MSCLTTFLTEHYGELQKLCRRKVRDNGDDLCNDICINLIESNNPHILEMCERGELWYYVVRIVSISTFSKTSRFYYKYKKHREFETDMTRIFPAHHDDSVSLEEVRKYQLKTIELILQDLDWFDAQLFKVYFLHEHSLKSLSDATGISKTTIQKSIAKTKDYIKEEVKRLRRHS